MKLCLLTMAALLFVECSNPNSKQSSPANKAADLSRIRIGISAGEVQELIGSPKAKADLGNYQDENGKTIHTEEWYYNDNQLVQLINDTVRAVILDVKSADEKIQRIIDSARNAGDTTSVLHSEGYSTE